MVDVITVTAEQFRGDFTEFSDTETYTDEVVNIFIGQSGCYVSTNNTGVLKDDCRVLALELMTAHLLTLDNKIKSGDLSSGQIASTSIDKISVSLTTLETNGKAFRYWLSQTPYGLRLLALLGMFGAAGIYAGGTNYRVFR